MDPLDPDLMDALDLVDYSDLLDPVDRSDFLNKEPL